MHKTEDEDHGFHLPEPEPIALGHCCIPCNKIKDSPGQETSVPYTGVFFCAFIVCCICVQWLDEVSKFKVTGLKFRCTATRKEGQRNGKSTVSLKICSVNGHAFAIPAWPLRRRGPFVLAWSGSIFGAIFLMFGVISSNLLQTPCRATNGPISDLCSHSIRLQFGFRQTLSYINLAQGFNQIPPDSAALG